MDTDRSIMVSGGPGQDALLEAAKQKKGKVVFHFGLCEGKHVTRVARCIKAPGQNPLWWLEAAVTFKEGDYDVTWIFYGGYNAHNREGTLWYAGKDEVKARGEVDTVMSIDADLLFTRPPWDGHNVE